MKRCNGYRQKKFSTKRGERRAFDHRNLLNFKSLHSCILIGILHCSSMLHADEISLHERKYYEIPSGELGYALSSFAIQVGIPLSFDPQLTASLQTSGLNGYYSLEQGFTKLLQGTSLKLVKLENKTWTLSQINDLQDHVLDTRNVGTLEVIQTSARASYPLTQANPSAHRSNLDQARSENDIQPYKILTQEDIQNSGVISIDELLKKTLLSNTGTPNFDASGFMGNSSQLNLRGLGTSETLVLVNGHRAAGVGYRGVSESTDQQNINNIPLAAIERIEVLPTTASAIYGSGAFGGVVNIILRRDYQGTEVNVRYDNSFSSDTAIKTINFVTGFVLDDSQTHILFTGYQSQANELTAADRDFHQQSRAKQISQYPNSIYGMNRTQTEAVNPPAGALVNIRTQDGSALLPQYSDASFAYLPKGYAGYRQDGFEPLKSTLGQYDLNLSDGLSNFSNSSSLVAASQIQAFGFNIYQPISDNIEAYFESSYNKSIQKAERGSYDRFGTVVLDANAENNPYGKTVLITYPVRWEDTPQRYRYITNENKQALIGFSYQPNDDWSIQADYKWSTAVIDLAHPRLFNEEQYVADYMSGALDLLRDTSSYSTAISDYWQTSRTYTEQTVQDYNLRSTGKISSWYAGKIDLVTGVEYRTIKGDGIPEYSENPTQDYLHQNNLSLYTEVKAPLISRTMDVPWIKALDVQFAARHEQSEIKTSNTTFSALSPTVGFRLMPHDSLIVRASYSEGVDYQEDSQLGNQQSSSESVVVIDPSNDQSVAVLAQKTGERFNPEKIKSINAGIVYSPGDMENLRLSVDYYKIKKRDGLKSLTAQEILNNESLFSDRIARDDQGNLLTVDTTVFNSTRIETSGFDFAASLYLDYLLHGVNLEVSYSYVDSYKEQILPSQQPIDYVNYLNQASLKNRATLMTTFNLTDQWTLGWGMQFYGKYKVLLSDQYEHEGRAEYSVASQTYHDVYLRYAMPQVNGAKWGSPELTFGIKNIFAQYEIDLTSTDISSFTDPRLRQYFFNLKFNF